MIIPNFLSPIVDPGLGVRPVIDVADPETVSNIADFEDLLSSEGRPERMTSELSTVAPAVPFATVQVIPPSVAPAVPLQPPVSEPDKAPLPEQVALPEAPGSDVAPPLPAPVINPGADHAPSTLQTQPEQATLPIAAFPVTVSFAALDMGDVPRSSRPDAPRMDPVPAEPILSRPNAHLPPDAGPLPLSFAGAQGSGAQPTGQTSALPPVEMKAPGSAAAGAPVLDTRSAAAPVSAIPSVVQASLVSWPTRMEKLPQELATPMSAEPVKNRLEHAQNTAILPAISAFTADVSSASPLRADPPIAAVMPPDQPASPAPTDQQTERSVVAAFASEAVAMMAFGGEKVAAPSVNLAPPNRGARDDAVAPSNIAAPAFRPPLPRVDALLDPITPDTGSKSEPNIAETITSSLPATGIPAASSFGVPAGLADVAVPAQPPADPEATTDQPTQRAMAPPLLPLIVQHAQGVQDGPVTVTLRPEELGTLRFEVRQSEQGLHLHLSVEQPGTLDLLRRHSEQLLLDLRQAGFSGATLTYSDGSAAAGGGPGNPNGDAPRHEGGRPPGATPFGSVPPNDGSPNAPPRAVAGILDLRL